MRSFPISVIAVLLMAGPLLAADQNKYEPLSDGAEWTMDVAVVAPSGETTGGTAHRKVEGQVKKDGRTYFRLRTWKEGAPAASDMVELARNDEAGYYTRADTEKDIKEQLEFPWPIKEGQTWRHLSGKDIILDTVIGFETVTIEGKSYQNCCHIQAKWFDGSVTRDHWEAPNVGTVKSEMVFFNGAKLTLTLKEYKPGK